MPLDFSSIPAHVQKNILQRVEIKDFANLESTSQEAINVIKHVKPLISIPQKRTERLCFSVQKGNVFIGFFKMGICGLEESVKLSDLPLMRLEANIFSTFRRHYLTEFMCRTLTKYCHRTGSRFNELRLRSGSELCSPTSFHKLLKAANVKRFSINGTVSPGYLRNLPQHIVEVEVNSKIDDSDFLNLNVRNICIRDSEITSLGLNQFLEKCINGNMIIESLAIWTKNTLDVDKVLQGTGYFGTREPYLYRILNVSQLLYIIVSNNRIEIFANNRIQP